MKRVFATCWVPALIILTASRCDESTGPIRVRQRWIQPQAGWSRIQPEIAGDVVLFGTGDTRVIARDTATGAVRWSTQVTSIAQTPAISGRRMVIRAGIAVVPVVRNTVALDVSTGRELWSYEAPLDSVDDPAPLPGGLSLSSPDADDRTAFIPASGASISAVDLATGVVRWRWGVDPTLGDRTGATGVRLSGDTLFGNVWRFFGNGVTGEVWLVALDRLTGAELWRVVIPNESGGTAAWGQPALYGNLVIVGLHSGYLFAIDRTSRQIVWRFVPSPVNTSYAQPEVVGDVVYVDVGEAAVYALDARTGAIRWRARYIASGSGHLSANLAITDRHVIGVDGDEAIFVDRLTGRIRARTSQPGTSEGLLSGPVAARGAVYFTANGAAWSVAEP